MKKPVASRKKESWVHNAKAGLKQYEKLKDHEIAKTYIQNAMTLSVKGRNMTLLLTALFDVAYANNKRKSTRLICLSDGTSCLLGEPDPLGDGFLPEARHGVTVPPLP